MKWERRDIKNTLEMRYKQKKTKNQLEVEAPGKKVRSYKNPPFQLDSNKIKKPEYKFVGM